MLGDQPPISSLKSFWLQISFSLYPPVLLPLQHCLHYSNNRHLHLSKYGTPHWRSIHTCDAFGHSSTHARADQPDPCWIPKTSKLPLQGCTSCHCKIRHSLPSRPSTASAPKRMTPFGNRRHQHSEPKPGVLLYTEFFCTAWRREPMLVVPGGHTVTLLPIEVLPNRS